MSCDRDTTGVPIMCQIYTNTALAYIAKGSIHDALTCVTQALKYDTIITCSRSIMYDMRHH